MPYIFLDIFDSFINHQVNVNKLHFRSIQSVCCTRRFKCLSSGWGNLCVCSKCASFYITLSYSIADCVVIPSNILVFLCRAFVTCSSCIQEHSVKIANNHAQRHHFGVNRAFIHAPRESTIGLQRQFPFVGIQFSNASCANKVGVLASRCSFR